MSKIIAASTTGLVFLCAIIVGTLFASNDNEALITTETGNTLSEKQKHGQKTDMLVGKISTADEKALKYQEKAAMVIATYQLSDPRDQHKLLSTKSHKDSKI